MPKASITSPFCHKVGLGFDSHSFGFRGKLVLGGITFSQEPALKGHSDGDAVLHAIIDALLGGGAMGDIGEFFPDTSHRWKGVSSRLMLSQVLTKMQRKRLRLNHLDLTIVADRPRLAGYKKVIKKKISQLLKLKESDINLKAKTLEGLSWFPPPGGLAVWALATLIPTNK